MAEQARDWSYFDGGPADILPNDEYRFDQFHKDVGNLGFKALEALCSDLTTERGDVHGWTGRDTEALMALSEIEAIADLMVPPETTIIDNRMAVIHRLRELNTGLPFDEGERWWLMVDLSLEVLHSEVSSRDEHFLDPVRAAETELVSNGITRRVHGRDLLQRFWSWRRGAGVYSGNEGLNQSRKALAGLVELLTPALGLPREYEALAGTASDDATSYGRA